MQKLSGRFSVIFLCTIIFVVNIESYSQVYYKMRIANCIKVRTNTIEFDVYIKSTGPDFILTSYQCALSFNQSIINNGNLGFSYIPGTSQLFKLQPANGIGVLIHNNIHILTFSSICPPYQEIITLSEKRVGRFRLYSNTPFWGNITNIIWNFEGNANTILTGSGFSDITNKLNHSHLSGSAAFPFSLLVEDGWNLVSIPGYHPVDQNVDTWWENRDKSVNVYNNNTQSVTNLEPGVGYWMKHTGSMLYNTGEEWPSEGIIYSPNYPIKGHSGWNLIGIYNYELSVKGIKTIPGGLHGGLVFKFIPGGGYLPVNILTPGYGYLISLIDSGLIILPDSGNLPLSKITSHYSNNWGKIIITDIKERSYTLYTITDGTDPDNCLLPPALNNEIFDIRFSTGKFAEDVNTGIHTIELKGIEYPIKVKIENTGIKLQDETGYILNTRLKSGEEIIINSDLNNKLLVSNDAVPDEYTLMQNYPNPFNPNTFIRYEIPQDGFVTVKIFNMLGQEVTTLFSGITKAGRYTLNWGGTDGNGKQASSGSYIYRMSAGEFIKSKKMILIK